MPTGTERLNGFTSLKRKQARTVAFVDSQDELLGAKMRGCATYLIFGEYSEHGGETRLRLCNFCTKYTLCRICATRRSVKLVEAYEPKVASVLQAAETLGTPLIPAMATLTLASGWDCGERITHLKESFSAMIAAKRKADSNPDKNTPIEWNKLQGSLRSIEATFSEEHGWHLHAHVFALLSRYIDVYRLADEWERFTGDSRVVDVRKCYGEPRAALHEVIKYACKFSDLTDERLFEFHRGVNGGRMFDPAGNLRGVLVGEAGQDTPLTGPRRDFLAVWNWLESKYDLRPMPELVSVPRVYA